jgi:hypothetical protein
MNARFSALKIFFVRVVSKPFKRIENTLVVVVTRQRDSFLLWETKRVSTKFAVEPIIMVKFKLKG